MAALSDSAIIVIVIVICLAVISLGAALSRHLAPPEGAVARFDPPEDQQMYMLSVRQRTLDRFRRESVRMKDLESAYDSTPSREPSYYISNDSMNAPQYSTPQLSSPRHYPSTQLSTSTPYT